jgi:amidase
MGVAPAEGDVPNSTPGPHGGNLDTRDVGIGSRLYLPVAHEGGLFGCGDVHALQGDGEVCGQGIEIGAEVTISFDYIKECICPWPVVETPDHYAPIAAAGDLDEATDLALLAARDLLIRYGGFTDQQALGLMSIVGDMRICQIVNPLRAVRACIPRGLLELPG